MKTKSLLRYGLCAFMLVAGINHFLNPSFYLPLIPDYFPYPNEINVISGVLEVVLALMLFRPKLRWYGAWGIFILLFLFIPSHIYFIQIGACVSEGLCTPFWVAWARLILVHPLLLYWAWLIRK